MTWWCSHKCNGNLDVAQASNWTFCLRWWLCGSQRSLWGTCFQRCVGQDASNVRILRILQTLDVDFVFAALRSSVVLQRRQCGLQPTISTRSDLLKVELRNPSCWTSYPFDFTEKRMEHQWISQCWLSHVCFCVFSCSKFSALPCPFFYFCCLNLTGMAPSTMRVSWNLWRWPRVAIWCLVVRWQTWRVRPSTSCGASMDVV